MIENNSQQRPPSQRNPYTPWFVVIAFVAPVVAAYGLYFFEVTPPAYNNKGELLHPVIDVESLAFTNKENEPMRRDDITQHKWHMMVFVGADCAGACNKVLYNIRQINIAAGKNSYRLRRSIVHLEEASPEFQRLIDEEYPEALQVNARRETIKSKLEQVHPDLDAYDIYLIDPLGNIMMRFTDTHSPKDILHDLKKLFKVSQIG